MCSRRDGFAFNDQKFRSLSAATKAITRTHLSGHRLFKIAELDKETAQ